MGKNNTTEVTTYINTEFMSAVAKALINKAISGLKALMAEAIKRLTNVNGHKNNEERDRNTKGGQ